MYKELAIEIWPTARLVPYVRPLRKNDEAVDRMMASITAFGFKVPILARSSGEVVDGHLRLRAALRLGMTEVPLILCDEWSETQVRAFRLMVNRSGAWAEWDDELVGLEMADLKALDFDLNLTGFDLQEIDEMLFAEEAQRNPEPELPEPQQHTVTLAGEMWICGPHRILCGDATSKAEVGTLCGDVPPTLMVTDPPYGVEYDPQWREQAGLGRPRQRGTIANDDQVDWAAAYQLFAGDVAYVWHAGLHAAAVAAGLQAAGFRIRAQIIWAKQHFALSRGDYHWQHEPCWYVVREGKPANWCGDRTQSTLWQVANLNPFGGSREETVTGHGTQKPVELMRRPILNHTQRGDIVYDPFLGSGTALVAAQLSDRICYGMDIDPRYVDVAVRRWQQLTKNAAVLASDGRSFEEVAAERTPPAEEV